MGWDLSLSLAAFRSAMRRKTWFPVSAQEWAASAVMDAEPEMSAAAVFAAATSMFAAKAMSTVSDAGPDFLRFTRSCLLWQLECMQSLRYPAGRTLGSVPRRSTLRA